MGCDPSPMVRRAIVRCIGATKVTLPIVLRRTLDVDENVRKAAYKFIADKVHIRSLTISRREEIIRRGLTDRNEGVRNVVAKDLGIIQLQFQVRMKADLSFNLRHFWPRESFRRPRF